MQRIVFPKKGGEEIFDTEVMKRMNTSKSYTQKQIRESISEKNVKHLDYMNKMIDSFALKCKFLRRKHLKFHAVHEDFDNWMYRHLTFLVTYNGQPMYISIEEEGGINDCFVFVHYLYDFMYCDLSFQNVREERAHIFFEYFSDSEAYLEKYVHEPVRQLHSLRNFGFRVGKVNTNKLSYLPNLMIPVTIPDSLFPKCEPRLFNINDEKCHQEQAKKTTENITKRQCYFGIIESEKNGIQHVVCWSGDARSISEYAGIFCNIRFDFAIAVTPTTKGIRAGIEKLLEITYRPDNVTYELEEAFGHVDEIGTVNGSYCAQFSSYNSKHPQKECDIYSRNFTIASSDEEIFTVSITEWINVDNDHIQKKHVYSITCARKHLISRLKEHLLISE